MTATAETGLAQSTAYAVVDQVRSFLEANGMDPAVLGPPLATHTNVNDTCNAFYDPSERSVNFFRSGGGCGNTGEIAGVSLHEYGHGLDENNVLGPIQNKMQYDKVVDLVEDARRNGARVLCGGEAPGGPGFFYPVTIVADATDGMRIVDEEQFGPVLPVIRYSDLDDAIERANALEVGLGGSAWSSDAAKAKAVASRLECGTAWVNNHGAIKPFAPFGGVKGSGLGVEFGKLGLEEYTAVQVVHQ